MQRKTCASTKGKWMREMNIENLVKKWWKISHKDSTWTSKKRINNENCGDADRAISIWILCETNCVMYMEEILINCQWTVCPKNPEVECINAHCVTQDAHIREWDAQINLLNCGHPQDQQRVTNIHEINELDNLISVTSKNWEATEMQNDNHHKKRTSKFNIYVLYNAHLLHKVESTHENRWWKHLINAKYI